MGTKHSIFFLSTEAQHIYLHLESGQLLSFLIQLYVIYASHQNSSATGSTGVDAFGSLFTSQNKVLGKAAAALPDCCKIRGTWWDSGGPNHRELGSSWSTAD